MNNLSKAISVDVYDKYGNYYATIQGTEDTFTDEVIVNNFKCRKIQTKECFYYRIYKEINRDAKHT